MLAIIANGLALLEGAGTRQQLRVGILAALLLKLALASSTHQFQNHGETSREES
jgi:hypothetical protein